MIKPTVQQLLLAAAVAMAVQQSIWHDTEAVQGSRTHLKYVYYHMKATKISVLTSGVVGVPGIGRLRLERDTYPCFGLT